ncbi:MAG: DUF1800 domain-containing protein [Caulobacteraceae bacterium]
MTTSSSADLKAAIAATRFGLGARPGEMALARHDPQGWLQVQIRAEGADQPQAQGGGALLSASECFQAFLAYREATRAAGQDADARKAARQPLDDALNQEVLARAWLGATTPSPFRERWALFWGNHFTVSLTKGEDVGATAAAFEREAIRPHVFGRFADLLSSSSRHPAMLMYLDQQNSVGPSSPAGLKRKNSGLNENLGREIMELHTLGVEAGYTQADVTEFARALTGWSMGGPGATVEQQGIYLYRSEYHEPGERRVFGKTYPSAQERQAQAALEDFAASPHTARHIARKVAAHFVADDPPPALTARLEAAYRRSDGDLAQVAQALISAPEAWDPAPRKLKTPNEFLISSHRAAGSGPLDARRDVLGPLGTLGQRPFAAPQPNGWSDTAADWAAPDAIIRRVSLAQGFAGAHAPKAGGRDPVQVAQEALGARLTPATLTAVQRAESRQEAFAVLLMSPEFQRR